MPNILFLSDNGAFAKDLSEQITLYARDFNLTSVDNGEVLFDLAVIDGQLSKVEAFQTRFPKTPILFLASEEQSAPEASPLIKVLYKPLILDSFLNQLKSGINILDNSADGYLSFNRYELRPVKREIENRRCGAVIKLTEKEVAILKYLYKARDKIVSKNELLREVWGYSPEVTTHTIETHIYRLRQKVEQDNPDAQLIITEEGGYKLKI